jgi:hypothetical protein
MVKVVMNKLERRQTRSLSLSLSLVDLVLKVYKINGKIDVGVMA